MEEIVLVADRAERLDRFLARAMPEHSRSRLAKWIEAGNVTVGVRTPRPSESVVAGTEVRVRTLSEPEPHDLTPQDLPVPVVFEDDHLLVVDKPRGWATHPATGHAGPTLVQALLARGTTLSEGSEVFRPGIVHRLDKDTTGLLVVAKTAAAHAHLAAQIEAKTAERRYLAVTVGAPKVERFRIEAPLGPDPKDPTRRAVTTKGKPALTLGRVLGEAGAGPLVGLRLATGRTHQIRVHLAAVGAPVLGDPLYGRGEPPMRLHAAVLAFDHPASGERVEFEAEPPEEFGGVPPDALARLREV